MKNISKALMLFAVVGLLAAGCSKATNTNINTNTTENTTTGTDQSQSTEGSTKTFTVNGSNFKFDMSEIRVNEGDTVVINFKNTGGMHDWVLDEFANAKTQVLKDGESETITFKADKKGTFEYYCSVGEHRQMGMKGNLIVE